MTANDTPDPDSLAISFDPTVARRLQALAADCGEPLDARVRAHLLEWLGDWGLRVATHTVAPGETLWAIARRYYGDGRKADVLAAYNRIADPTLLQVGDAIAVPEPAESAPLPAGQSPYLHGLHDRGGEYLMERAGKPGWVLCSETVGADPNDWSSATYADLAGRGLGVIVRLNNGYCPGGTLPPRQDYAAFAQRCGNFVEKSDGCHLWVIGNEPNTAVERPGGPRHGQPILPADYAAAFRACRDEIRSRPGHEADQVITAAVGPWNSQTAYPGNLRGDWVTYLADILAALDDALDGISLHAYSRDADPASIRSEERMAPPFQERRAGFRAYMDFMAAIPEALRHLPVYITEADQDVPWEDANRGWIQGAYDEVAAWNGHPAHQRIRCLILYRWQRRPHDIWHLEGKREVLADLEGALRLGHRWHP